MPQGAWWKAPTKKCLQDQQQIASGKKRIMTTPKTFWQRKRDQLLQLFQFEIFDTFWKMK